MPHKLVVQLGHEVFPVLEANYWDKTLTPSMKNPYPLAPVDKVEAGEVNDESYLEHNSLLGESIRIAMIPQLIQIIEEPGFADNDAPRGIEILGAGLLRDLGWLCDPVVLNFSNICITDNSSVACTNIEKFIEKNKLSTSVSPCMMGVEEAWKASVIQDEITLIYYAGQFIQNQKERAKNRMMQHFGRFLKMATPDGCFRRRVYLLHPRGEDNPADKVRWRNTIPWMDEELRVPLERGFGGPVLMEPIANHLFWHQLYTLFRLSAPPNFEGRL